MKNIALGLALTAALSGCASVASDSYYSVRLVAEQENTPFTVTNSSGLVVHEGVAPATIGLRASDGFFQGQTYLVNFNHQETEKSQTHLLDSSIDNWYYGNILLGGLIGLLIIDPATGAMFELPEYVDEKAGVFDEYADYATFITAPTQNNQ